MMTKVLQLIKKQAKEKGQSLVEIALVLPIFILIVAGIVEIANLLNTQNKLTTASRIAAGYGAANYDEENFDVTAQDMGQIALNTVTETLELDYDRWDIWSASGKTDLDGTDFLTSTYRHVKGNNQIVTNAEWEASWPGVRDDMVISLREEAGCSITLRDPSDPCPEAADIRVVASVPYFRQEAILGLNVSKWANLDKQRGFTVMRVDTRDRDVTVAAGCPLLPIAVRVDQWALYPSNWLDQTGQEEDEGPFDLYFQTKGWFDTVFGTAAQPFPPFDSKIWEFPACTSVGGPCKADDPIIPVYTDSNMDPNKLAPVPVDESYSVNLPGFPLSAILDNLDEGIGYIFWAREQTKGMQEELGGNFGWLTWDGNPSADKLKDSLDYPNGDFVDIYPFSRADMGELININDYYPDPPFAGLSGDTDHWLEPGEWVEGAPGDKDTAGKHGLDTFIYNDTLTTTQKYTEVVLVLFDELNEDSGSNINYQVAGFARARVLGYNFGGNPGNKDTLYDGKWIVFELLGEATGCYNPKG